VAKATASLKSRKAIEQLFRQGRSFSSDSIRLIWLERADLPLHVLYSVPKAGFRRAVDRNLIKRRMREAFREVYISKRESGQDLRGYLGLVYTAKEIKELGQIRTALAKLLDMFSR
jgi:ribonuclease P protein component